MTISKTLLISAVLLSGSVLCAKHAQAGGFKFGGGSGNGGNGQSSFKHNHTNNNSSHNQFKNGSPMKPFWNGGSNHHNNHHNGHHDHHHHTKHWSYPSKYPVRYVEPVRYVYTKCYYPDFQCCYVYPGDTWYSISKRIYGVDYMCKHIASYNGLSMSSRLVVGQMLRLPVINANGSLASSNAPMPAPFVQPALETQPAAFATAAAESMPPAASIRTISEEPALARVAVGSTLEIDGSSMGTETGVVRLRVGGLALPVEVLEWSANSVKIRLPKVELSSEVRGELEVLRADGSVASNSGVALTPAAPKLALSK